MKKIVFTIELIGIIVFNSSAQIEGGKVFLSGTTYLGLGETSAKVDNNTIYQDRTTINFTLSPGVGGFITNRILLGLIIDLRIMATEYDNGGKSSTEEYAFAPFMRYYFTTKRVAPYIHADVSSGEVFRKYTPKTGKGISYNSSSKGWSLITGVSSFVNDNVAFDFGFGYLSTTYTIEQRDPISGVNEPIKQKYIAFGFDIGIIVLL